MPDHCNVKWRLFNELCLLGVCVYGMEGDRRLGSGLLKTGRQALWSGDKSSDGRRERGTATRLWGQRS